jgi:hypothetical protein
VRRYEVIVIHPHEISVRDWSSPEYFEEGDELALDGRIVLVYRVERLPSGKERLICLPPRGNDPRVRVAA